MKEVSEKEFNEISKVKIVNILDGFDNYSSGIIETSDFETLNNILKDCYFKSEDAIIDYYGNTISEESFKNVMNNLNEKEKLLLKDIKNRFDNNIIYFKKFSLEELELVNKLSINGILFSTYSFISDEVVIWSNYNKKFPIFFKDNKTIEKYKKICATYNVGIENLLLR